MKRLFFVLILSLLLVACGSKNDANNNDVAVEDKVYAVGDTVKFNNMEIKLKDVSFADIEGKRAPENDKVLTLDVKVANKRSKDDLLVDNLHFKLADADGEIMDIYYGFEENDIHGIVPTGKSLDGKLFFDVTESEYYELRYTPATKENQVTLTFKIEM